MSSTMNPATISFCVIQDFRALFIGYLTHPHERENYVIVVWAVAQERPHFTWSARLFCNSARGAASEDERLQEAESARACSLHLRNGTQFAHVGPISVIYVYKMNLRSMF